MARDPDCPYVSRAGLKIAHALDTFDVDPTGLRCADLGCNVGGFTDCLLQRGAACVYAVDTSYGTLDYRLRVDDRVVVHERTNALHVELDAPVDLVVVDLGWTPQRHAVPAALRCLADGGRIISLVKPHYELTASDRREKLEAGRLDPAIAESILEDVCTACPGLGVEVLARDRSPIAGGKSSRGGKAGNIEFLVLLRRADDAPPEPSHDP
jgi:23S rRNA (cytidine1920-2'-O)/16S rRNA (cytidine1409-2'-O)-methyltransferase